MNSPAMIYVKSTRTACWTKPRQPAATSSPDSRMRQRIAPAASSVEPTTRGGPTTAASFRSSTTTRTGAEASSLSSDLPPIHERPRPSGGGLMCLP